LLTGWLLAGCLPDNPSGGETDATGSETTGDITPVDNMIGCPTGETCWVVLTAQTLDDRVEVFGGLAGSEPTYRGAIDLDLKPGTEPGQLDEPFGMALSDTGLHVITGHYPSPERGALLTFPTAFFDERDPALIDVDTFFAGGAFNEGVVETRFDELEPIFALSEPVQGKLLVSVFANDLFAADDTWTEPGKLAIVDTANPADFALATLSGLDGGDCRGASQLVLLEDENTAAVACDGNEAVAFLDLGDLSGSPTDIASGITGSLCDLPPTDSRRARYLAHDGAGGVLVGLGPTPLNASATQVYSIPAGCEPLSPIAIADSDGQLGELVRFGDSHWLLAQGAISAAADRGVQVISPTGVCNTLPGLEDAWETDGEELSPYALAVAPDGEHMLIGAGPTQTGNATNAIFGRVLWVSLEGTDDPCSMTAEFVDLTDGASGHAPAPLAADTTTWRRSPSVVVLTEVQGT